MAATATAVGFISSVIGFRFDREDRICYLAPMFVCLEMEVDVFRAMALDFSFFFCEVLLCWFYYEI